MTHDKNDKELSEIDSPAEKSPKEKKKKSKRRMSASEYQKYILMEQGNIEVDSQGNPSLAEQAEEPAMLIRIPSWLAISNSTTTQSNDEADNYVNMEKNAQPAPPQKYMTPPTRWQRYKAEFCDLFHELLNYGKNKSWKKKVLTVVVCASSFLVFADLLFFGNIARWLQAFILWMGNNIILGIFAFIGLFVVTTRTSYYSSLSLSLLYNVLIHPHFSQQSFLYRQRF